MKEPAAPRALPNGRAQSEDIAEFLGTLLGALDTEASGGAIDAETLREKLSAIQATIAALRSDSVRRQALLDAILDPILALDREGRILDANEAAAALLSRSRSRMIGRSLAEIAPDWWTRGVARLISEAGRQGDSASEADDDQGNESSAGAWSRSLIELEGQALFVLFRREQKAETLRAELRRAEHRLAELLRSIEQGILVEDAEGRILEANPAARRLLGFPDGDLPPLSALASEWHIVDGDGMRLREKAIPSRIAIETGETVHRRLLGIPDRDGTRYRWLEVTAIPQWPEGALRPERVISVIQDVTELQRDLELFARVQRLGCIAGFEWWPGTGVVFCTPQWGELGCGASGPELRWEDFVQHFVEEDRARLVSAFEESVRDHGELALECRVRRPDGHRRWVRIRGQADHIGAKSVRLSGIIQDITEEKRREEELQMRADTDPLTGLLNRDAILRSLAAHTAHAGGRVALLHIDLDRFKLANDLLGHETGDRLLAAAAARLRAAVSAGVPLGRLTGDEFLMILPASFASRAETVAEVLVRAFERPFRIGEQEFPLGISIGLARAPEDASDMHQLLMQAEAALEEAKRRGRKGWVGSSGVLVRDLGERIAIESNLRLALEHEEFELVFQPQIDLRDGRIVGAEALLRWHSPKLGMVSPERFIPQAEASGDIVRIGRWIIEEACRRLASWRRSGLALERLSINLSYRQLVSTRVADDVLRALFEYELSGEMLEVEITERILAEEVSDVRPILQALRAAGIGIVIDDFGEGYSALDRLRRLPIQTLKISHRFTAGVPHVAGDVAICQAIIGVARGLGLEVIAEGVETEAQRSFMQRNGVRIVQGYLFSRPLPAQQFVQFYRERRSLA